MSFNETVLLVEGYGSDMKVRTMGLSQRFVNTIFEKLHLDPLDNSKVYVRTWENKQNEMDLTGKLRVFREVLPPSPPEPDEKPLFDEMVLKEPLPFFEDETPLGWRRKHLRKAPKPKKTKVETQS